MKANLIIARAFRVLAGLAFAHSIYGLFAYGYYPWHILGVIAILLTLANTLSKADRKEA